MRRVGTDIVRDEQVFEIDQLVSLQLSAGKGRSAAVPDGLDVGQIDQAVRCKAWIDQDVFQMRKIEFYDRKDELLKTLTYSKYKQYLDQYWRADEMFMDNHQTGKSTTLLWRDYEFRVGLTDRDFDQNTLKRVR